MGQRHSVCAVGAVDVSDSFLGGVAWGAAKHRGSRAACLGAKQCVRGAGICKKRGTVLDAQICQLEDRQNRKPTRVGVARDKDSVYKISFCLLDPCY